MTIYKEEREPEKLEMKDMKIIEEAYLTTIQIEDILEWIGKVKSPV